MFDSTFKNVDRLLVQSFKTSEDDAIINYFVKYHMPLIKNQRF